MVQQDQYGHGLFEWQRWCGNCEQLLCWRLGECDLTTANFRISWVSRSKASSMATCVATWLVFPAAESVGFSLWLGNGRGNRPLREFRHFISRGRYYVCTALLYHGRQNCLYLRGQPWEEKLLYNDTIRRDIFCQLSHSAEHVVPQQLVIN